jgi:polygalacturonase
MCVSRTVRGGRRLSPEQAIQRAVAGAAFLLVPSLTATVVLAGDPTPPPLPSITGTTTTTVSLTGSASGNTSAIQSAITALPTAGGTVIIPTGTWSVDPMTFNSGNVDLEINGQIVAPTANSGGWGANTDFITWNNAKNSEITGSGSIDGEGGIGPNDWWSQTNNAPDLIHFSNAQTTLVTGVTFYNSPKEFFTFGGTKTNDVTFNAMSISAPNNAPNTVGIDPNGNNFLITNSTISTGDDDIALNAASGNSADTNIAITNMSIGLGHGVSIGSITSLGVNNLYVNNITFNGTAAGFRLKAPRSANGGLVQNLSYNNVTMTNVFYPVYISSWYNGVGQSFPSNANSTTANTFTSGVTPQWQNITFNNVTSSWTSTTVTNYTSSIAGLLYGLPESVIQNVTFSNVSLSAYHGMSLAFAGTSTAPISFTGNWSIITGTGQQFGTFTSPNSTNLGGNDGGGSNPGKLLYWNGGSTTGGTFTGWEASNIVNLSLAPVPEPTTASLALMGSAMALMRRRRGKKSTS